MSRLTCVQGGSCALFISIQLCVGRTLVKASHPYYLYHENLFFVNAVNRNESLALAAFQDDGAMHPLGHVSQLPVAGAEP
mgnify:CR=1 FL=1